MQLAVDDVFLPRIYHNTNAQQYSSNSTAALIDAFFILPYLLFVFTFLRRFELIAVSSMKFYIRFYFNKITVGISLLFLTAQNI